MAKKPATKPTRKLEATEAASKATNADKVAKPNEKKPKGKDNNKRLAQLEAKELAREYPFAFRAGQDARAANIPENQMPVLNDKEREAYLLGRNG